MAVGDVKSAMPSVNAAAALDILPSGSDQWVIHNIYLPEGGPFLLQFYDGTNVINFSSETGPKVLANMQFHVDSSIRIRVLNNDSVARRIGYDGVQTK